MKTKDITIFGNKAVNKMTKTDKVVKPERKTKELCELTIRDDFMFCKG